MKVGGVLRFATNKTWLALGLADAPRVANVDWSGKLTPTSSITISGTSDATDTITIYTNSTHAVGPGHRRRRRQVIIVVFVPVRAGGLTATQTVTSWAHVGLTSDESSTSTSPSIRPRQDHLHLAPALPRAPPQVTINDTVTPDNSIALYDGSHYLGSTTVNAAELVAHGEPEHQQALADGGADIVVAPDSAPSGAATVTAPPPAPSINTLPVGSLALGGASARGRRPRHAPGAHAGAGTALVASTGHGRRR